MTSFFVPDCAGAEAEAAYAAIRSAVEERTGHRPLECRIEGLACRRDGVDLFTSVGDTDPTCGKTVVAILDLGRHLPYLIQCGTPGDADDRQILIDKPVYSVTKFS